MIQNFFSLSLLDAWEDLSVIFTVEIGQVSEGKTLKSVKAFMWQDPHWSFYLSGLSILSLQQFVNCSSGFPISILISMEVSFCCSKLWFCLSTCLLLQFVGQNFSLEPYFSDGFKKSCWFFSLFTFTCQDGMVTSKLLILTKSLKYLFRYIKADHLLHTDLPYKNLDLQK